MKKKYLLLLPLFLCVCALTFAVSKSSTDTGYLGNDQWAVQSDGDVVPLTDSSYDLGESGGEIANIYVDSITTSGALNATGDITGDGTGTISGMLADEEVGVTTDTLTVTESGIITVCTANCDKTLPTASDGLIYTIVDGAGVTATVDTGLTTDTIEYLTLDAGDAIDSTGATGDSVTLLGDGTNNKWYVVSMKGSWTDGGAD